MHLKNPKTEKKKNPKTAKTPLVAWAVEEVSRLCLHFLSLGQNTQSSTDSNNVVSNSHMESEESSVVISSSSAIQWNQVQVLSFVAT
jgi:hypothetical protein